MNTVQFTISGFHCDACIKLSTLKLKKIPGVTQVNIAGMTGKTELIADRPVAFAEVQVVMKDLEYTVQQ